MATFLLFKIIHKNKLTKINENRNKFIKIL